MKVDTIALSSSAVQGLLAKTKLDPHHVNHLIWGNVVVQTNAPNCAREIVIDLALPKHITAHSTSMACASGLNAITQATTLIESGHADVVIAGGSDSVSNGELPIPRRLAYGLAQFVYGKQKGVAAIPNFFKEAGYNPLKWLPTPPAIAERSTGKTMGWHGDMIAEMTNISRADQEQLAITSHRNAMKARKAGYLDEEIFPLEIDLGRKGKKKVSRDNIINEKWEAMAEKLPKLKPAFRKPSGTITAATSSALTDGASAVLVMSEEKARELGYPTDISLASWQFSAIDPYPSLLLAPCLAWPVVLQKAGLKLSDIDCFEVHEAFAAQVLATLKCLSDKAFCERYLATDKPLINGEAEMAMVRERLNVNGSSISIGHPFAATGGRLVTSSMNELRRSGKHNALISICAAGGLGGVGIVQRK